MHIRKVSAKDETRRRFILQWTDMSSEEWTRSRTPIIIYYPRLRDALHISDSIKSEAIPIACPHKRSLLSTGSFTFLSSSYAFLAHAAKNKSVDESLPQTNSPFSIVYAYRQSYI